MIKKNRLFTPGPTEVPADTLRAMAEPIFHHRTPRFRTLFEQIQKDLQEVFQTKNHVLVFASSGTGAMEAAIAGAVPDGEKVLVIRGGKFGERFGEICETHRIPFVALDVPWGKAPNPADIAAGLAKDPAIGMVCATLCETSTGVQSDIRAIGEVVRKTPALLVVDGISGAGAAELRADAWGVDMLVNGSQKALMMPPGLAFLTVSPKAAEKIAKAPQRSYYFNLHQAIKAGALFDTPWTPAISLLVGLGVSLAAVRKEGMEAVWARHRLLAEATRAGVKALGLTLYAEAPSDSCTAVNVPPGVDGKKLTKTLEEEFGLMVAGGQEELSGKIFRISHMGYSDRMDMITVLAALGMTLVKLGGKCDPGAGVAAAQGVFLKG
ncbi:MAG: alanine--glyoxylate aminotransferase family protein [Planctomycetota bacterium]